MSYQIKFSTATWWEQVTSAVVTEHEAKIHNHDPNHSSNGHSKKWTCVQQKILKKVMATAEQLNFNNVYIVKVLVMKIIWHLSCRTQNTQISICVQMRLDENHLVPSVVFIPLILDPNMRKIMAGLGDWAIFGGFWGKFLKKLGRFLFWVIFFFLAKKQKFYYFWAYFTIGQHCFFKSVHLATNTLYSMLENFWKNYPKNKICPVT